MNSTSINYSIDRISRLTAKALEAESKYIVAFDRAATTADELDFARCQYELALGVLGRAINEGLNEVYKGQVHSKSRAA